MTGWRPEKDRLPEWAYRALPDQDHTRDRELQDIAAGEAGRSLTRDDGQPATARVLLRRRHNSRRTYAILRWSVGRCRNDDLMIGEVTDKENRLNNLRQAWSMVHRLGLLKPQGRKRQRARRSSQRRGPRAPEA